jgi:hypothetical protein
LGRRQAAMTTNRTHFAHRIDKVDEAGGALEHLAGAEDSGLADAVYRAARKRWPDDAIMLRHEARVIRDSRQETPPAAASVRLRPTAPAARPTGSRARTRRAKRCGDRRRKTGVSSASLNGCLARICGRGRATADLRGEGTTRWCRM